MIGLWHWVNPGHFQTNQVPYILLIHPNIYDIPLYPRKHIPFTYTPRNIQFISHSTSHLPREISNSMTYPIKYWLVVWNICYFSHHIGNVIIPTDFHSIIFQRGRLKPPTRSCLIGGSSRASPARPSFGGGPFCEASAAWARGTMWTRRAWVTGGLMVVWIVVEWDYTWESDHGTWILTLWLFVT